MRFGVIDEKLATQFANYVWASLPIRYKVKAWGPHSVRNSEFRLLVEEVGKTSFTNVVATKDVLKAIRAGALDLLAEQVAQKIKEHK